MNAKKDILSDVFSHRLQSIKRFMLKNNIKTLREIAKVSGVDPASLSLAFNGKSNISEKTARLIEKAYNLPHLYLDGTSDLNCKIPVYEINNYSIDKDNSPTFFIESLNISDDCFYIIVTKNCDLDIPIGANLLLKPIDSIRELKNGDICLIQHKDDLKISYYELVHYKTKNERFSIKDCNIIAKCIRIDL